MMNTLVYLSRAFVEFGPFTTKEMLDFHSRGLLRDIDHIRLEGEEQWTSAEAWVTGVSAPAKTSAKPKAKAAAIKKEPEPKPKPKTPAKKVKKAA